MKLKNDSDKLFNYDYIYYSKNPNINPHFHNYYEILLLEKGDAMYMVEGKNYDFSIGDIMLTNPRELHNPVFKSSNEYERSIISFKPGYIAEFITDSYNPLAALEKRRVGTNNKIPADVSKKYELKKKIKLIGEYANSDLPEKEIMIKSLLIQFLVDLNNIFTNENFITYEGKIFEIIQYINANITNNITLDLLAKEFYLSKYYISHEFKNKIGITLTEYITRKRIYIAKELILSKVPVSQAAQSVGFNEYSSFYRAFTKILGMSPTDIKKFI